MKPAPAPATSEPYVPQPGVIEQNEMFDYALKHAPNVLYSRYKQYGQVRTLSLYHHHLALTQMYAHSWACWAGAPSSAR